MSVGDLTSRRVVATIPVGRAPRKVAVQPGRIPSAAGPAPPGQRTIDGVVFADHGTRDVSRQHEVVLRADDYYFALTFLRARAGQRVRLRVENSASTLHNLTAPALRLDLDVPPRERLEVDLVLLAPGRVHLFCKFHGPLGQNGQLLIVD